MNQTIHEMIKSKALAAKSAMRRISKSSSEVRNSALLAMADCVLTFKDEIREANEIDLQHGRKSGLAEPLMSRLALDDAKIERMANNLREVAALPDPIGEVLHMGERPNGLQIGTVRVPIGVVGVIYESRPDVTVEVSALCIKSGNAVILRGGSEAIHSNNTLARILSEAAESRDIGHVVQCVDITDRQAVQAMISMSGMIDLIVPRGSQEFIRHIMKASDIPVVGHADGICHVYVDDAAELEMAEKICMNAKLGYKVAVCNAMETLLVHEAIAPRFLPGMCKQFLEKDVELRGCEKTQKICTDAIPANTSDWETEYLDKILSVRIVDDFNQAVEHIETYGSHHSDAIITESYSNAQRFLRDVDSAVVYVNASTCFTDGYEFGLGAEVGISTQKLHCRGPMGLEGLTSYKYVVRGNGQVRS